MIAQLLEARRLRWLEHDHGERSLAPLRVGHTDHGGLAHRGMPHQRVLDLLRADPLAAALDHVGHAIGQLHEAMLVDAIPRTSAGKFKKTELRETYKDRYSTAADD